MGRCNSSSAPMQIYSSKQDLYGIPVLFKRIGEGESITAAIFGFKTGRMGWSGSRFYMFSLTIPLSRKRCWCCKVYIN